MTGGAFPPGLDTARSSSEHIVDVVTAGLVSRSLGIPITA